MIGCFLCRDLYFQFVARQKAICKSPPPFCWRLHWTQTLNFSRKWISPNSTRSLSETSQSAQTVPPFLKIAKTAWKNISEKGAHMKTNRKEFVSNQLPWKTRHIYQFKSKVGKDFCKTIISGRNRLTVGRDGLQKGRATMAMKTVWAIPHRPLQIRSRESGKISLTAPVQRPFHKPPVTIPVILVEMACIQKWTGLGHMIPLQTEGIQRILRSLGVEENNMWPKELACNGNL